MLSPEEINDIHYQLDHMPSSFTNKRKRELRRELNKALKEHEYASTYPPFEPTGYEIVFVNRLTSINTLITLDTRIKETNIFTLDTESITKKSQPNVPALIQIQLCSETSSIVIIVEVHHLLFIKKNQIFIWGEAEELKEFVQFNLFNLQQIHSSTNRNVQHEFKLYWKEVYPHQENPNEKCQCKHCFDIHHDNSLSLQDAVAFELRQWLDKRLTRQSFNIGLDPQLRRLNPRESQYRQSLCIYAANDCDAIYRIITHSNIINDQCPGAAPTNNLYAGNLFDEIINELGDHETDNGINDEIVLDEQGHAMIIGEQFPIIKADPPATIVEHINPLSEAEKKKIHNRSRTKHQRARAYAREIILYDIEKRFKAKTIKQMLKEHGVSITQVNPVKSKRTGQITLYIGIKEPVGREKYEELKQLFTYKNYRRLFPHKFKKEENQHRRTGRPQPHAYKHNQWRHR